MEDERLLLFKRYPFQKRWLNLLESEKQESFTEHYLPSRRLTLLNSKPAKLWEERLVLFKGYPFQKRYLNLLESEKQECLTEHYLPSRRLTLLDSKPAKWWQKLSQGQRSASRVNSNNDDSPSGSVCSGHSSTTRSSAPAAESEDMTTPASDLRPVYRLPQQVTPLVKQNTFFKDCINLDTAPCKGKKRHKNWAT